jgi:hypothetical protein
LVRDVWDNREAFRVRLFLRRKAVTSSVARRLRSGCTRIERIAGHCCESCDYVYKRRMEVVEEEVVVVVQEKRVERW